MKKLLLIFSVFTAFSITACSSKNSIDISKAKWSNAQSFFAVDMASLDIKNHEGVLRVNNSNYDNAKKYTFYHIKANCNNGTFETLAYKHIYKNGDVKEFDGKNSKFGVMPASPVLNWLCRGKLNRAEIDNIQMVYSEAEVGRRLKEITNK